MVEALYEPESERYGGEHGIEAAHAIFMHDSYMTIDLAGDVRLDQLVAAASALDLLSYLGLTAEEVSEVYGRRLARLALDLGTSEQHLRDQAERSMPRFTARWAVASALARQGPGSDRHTVGLARAGARLRQAAEAGLLGRALSDIAADVQHMHFNRLDVPARREASLVLLTGQAIGRGLLP
jgi:thiopeptide-type bacteriocin biosynthesis protein